jgi:hypothetical protein
MSGYRGHVIAVIVGHTNDFEICYEHDSSRIDYPVVIVVTSRWLRLIANDASEQDIRSSDDSK